MPKTSRDYNPAAIMLGLDEILVRHGFYMGWGELASWDLTPRLTHHEDGSATLTAFHDPGGAPAVRYHRSENGTISLHTASTSQPIPEWLFPPNSYHPKTGQRRKPTRRDAPRLQVINHTETGRQQQHLMLTCTELMLILRHQLMLRLAATAAAVASDYLPNRIIQYAMTQVSSRLRNECIPNPLIPARHVAVEAMLRAVHPSTCRELLRQQLDPARELTPLPPYEEPPLREREPPPTPKPPNRLNAHYSLPVTRPRDSSVVAAAGQLNTDLLDQLLDAETLETLLSLTAPKDQPLYASLAATQIRDYNKVHSSMPAYGTMTKTSPSLTRIYLQDRHLSYMPPRSPQDITERLRGEYADRRHDMTDSQWQHFQRLANMPRLQGARYEPLRITAEAVALAGQPEPTDRALLTLYRSHQILFDHMYRHLSLTRQTQDAAWKHTLHTFLDPKTQTTQPQRTGTGAHRHDPPTEKTQTLAARNLERAREAVSPLDSRTPGQRGINTRKHRVVQTKPSAALVPARTRRLPAHPAEHLQPGGDRGPAAGLPSPSRHEGDHRRPPAGLPGHRPGPRTRSAALLDSHPLLGTGRDRLSRQAETTARPGSSGRGPDRSTPGRRPEPRPRTAQQSPAQAHCATPTREERRQRAAAHEPTPGTDFRGHSRRARGADLKRYCASTATHRNLKQEHAQEEGTMTGNIATVPRPLHSAYDPHGTILIFLLDTNHGRRLIFYKTSLNGNGNPPRYRIGQRIQLTNAILNTHPAGDFYYATKAHIRRPRSTSTPATPTRQQDLYERLFHATSHCHWAAQGWHDAVSLLEEAFPNSVMSTAHDLHDPDTEEWHRTRYRLDIAVEDDPRHTAAVDLAPQRQPLPHSVHASRSQSRPRAPAASSRINPPPRPRPPDIPTPEHTLPPPG